MEAPRSKATSQEAPRAKATEAPTDRLVPETVVAERYRVVDLLGEGAMGAVYRVEHLHMRKTFALKVLHLSVSSNPEIVARFEREAVAAGGIEHPNVAAATDFGKLSDGSFFLVLEFVGGRSLRTEVEAGPLPPARALHVIRGVLSGVGAAHAKGIVHRDLKPENIMLVERDGDPDFAKVLDFGIARVDPFGEMSQRNGVQALTQIGAVMGTPDYMSPEQAAGDAVDARSDLYSVGVILFELLTGACPFRGGAVTVLRKHVLVEAPPIPPEIAANLDPRVGEILRTLMAKAPDQRFQSAPDVIAALDELTKRAEILTAEPAMVSSGEPIDARAATIVAAGAGVGARFGRARVRVGIGVLAALIVLGVALVLETRGHRGDASASASRDNANAEPLPSASASAENAPAPPLLPPLPPPPSPESAQVTAKAPPAARAPQRAATPAPRRTGPGGIYIPPPKDWFR